MLSACANWRAGQVARLRVAGMGGVGQRQVLERAPGHGGGLDRERPFVDMRAVGGEPAVAQGRAQLVAGMVDGVADALDVDHRHLLAEIAAAGQRQGAGGEGGILGARSRLAAKAATSRGSSGPAALPAA